MAPPGSSILERDASPSNTLYNPVASVFGLIIVCVVIMAPMLWMLWYMRTEDPNSSSTRWPRRNSATDSVNMVSLLQQSPAYGVGIQRDTQSNRQTRNPLVRSIRATLEHSAQAVVAQSSSLGRRAQQLFFRAMPSRRKQRQNTGVLGVDIDLPVMPRPTWQKLASTNATPSTSTDNLGGAMTAGRASSAARLDTGGVHDVEGMPARPEPAVTIGLTIG